MIILRKNRIIVVECKFTKDPVGFSVVNDMEMKIKNLNIPKKNSISTVLISAGGVTDEVVQSEFFDIILSLDIFYK